MFNTTRSGALRLLKTAVFPTVKSLINISLPHSYNNTLIRAIASTAEKSAKGSTAKSKRKVRKGVSTLMDSVVKVFCTSAEPNFSQPWQRQDTDSSTSSGFVIKGKRVLTNAHSVEYFTQVMLKKRGSNKKYKANVLAIGAECDIAMLTVDDDKFWEGVSPVEFGDLPTFQDDVTVVGYPIGGDSISVTKGVVSRIEVIDYAHGSSELLGLQIDAAINPGNSGGPAFNDDEICVGIAFQSLWYAQTIGYVIPVPVIKHFIQDFDSNGAYTGFPGVGFEWQEMENPDLRQSMGMKPDQTGILVNRIDPTSPEALVLKVSDIILSYDGVDIANDGTVPFRYGERLGLNYLVSQKYVGETVEMKVLRETETLDLKITLGSPKNLIPSHINRRLPPYYIIAGFVLTPLTVPYIRSEHEDDEKMMDKLRHGVDEEIVIISQVLDADINTGYQHLSDAEVLSCNGQRVKNLKSLASMIESCTDEYLKFEVKDIEAAFTNDKQECVQIVVLQTKRAKAATVDILSTYSIPSVMSDDIRDSITNSSSNTNQQ